MKKVNFISHKKKVNFICPRISVADYRKMLLTLEKWPFLFLIKGEEIYLMGEKFISLIQVVGKRKIMLPVIFSR